jgi:hypothetical protein
LDWCHPHETIANQIEMLDSVNMETVSGMKYCEEGLNSSRHADGPPVDTVEFDGVVKVNTMNGFTPTSTSFIELLK